MSNSEPDHNGHDALEAAEMVRRLRWLMAESSGTIAHIAHQLEMHAAELDDDAFAQLRDDASVLDDDLATLKALLLGPVDWDAEYGRLLAGEIAPFDAGYGEDDEID